MIRLGSIGSGRRGRIAKLAHRPEEGFELAMICDPKVEVQQAYQREFGPNLQIAGHWREVIECRDIEIVFITTPDYLHEEQTVAALQAGKTVYLEKPMAITVEGCDRILCELQRGAGRLYVGHNMRFFPVMRMMKTLIDNGRIGEVQAIWCRHFVDYGGDAYFKDWHSERQYTTGLLLQKGAHDIDIIHWLAGGYTRRTVGMGKLSVYNRVQDRHSDGDRISVEFNENNWPPLSQTRLSPTIDVEDHSMMLMQLNNGVQASYCQCHYAPDGHRNYTIIGTEGRIENDGDHSDEHFMASVRLWTRRCGNRLDEHERIQIPMLEGTHGGADRLIIDDFLRFVTTGESDGATPLDARMSVAAGAMATRSLREANQPLDIPPISTEDTNKDQRWP